MPSDNRRYDLVLVLSPAAEDERRAKIVTDVEAQITAAGGELVRNDDWQQRPLAFEIAHQKEGEYHLLQFQAPTSVLEPLSHNLRIDDAVLRFRIIREIRGTPPAPEAPPPLVVGAPAPAATAAASAGPSDTEEA
ncbi:MAG TPA: 30S ribosomal protein S6 [Solirubrobacteraceae bacterium]|nr:30S ribosomal protein S6 [Solirubrobacteraceae bacterium]